MTELWQLLQIMYKRNFRENQTLYVRAKRDGHACSRLLDTAVFKTIRFFS